MADTDVDVLIIGGGIYGCGIAQAAAANGYRVRLIEQNTIASGTSSQSTKLIHGGLRYLEQGQLKLVYEALAEREQLLRLAPSLVSRQWFYIPVYASSKRPAWLIYAGLLLYWLLSKGRSRCRWLPRKQWADMLPGLKLHGLTAVLAYEDAATDDAALTQAVAASAQALGCEISIQNAVIKAIFKQHQWQLSLKNGQHLSARVVVNAAGAWVNHVCQHIQPAPPQLPVRLVQGSHLILNRCCVAYMYLESGDERVMFVRPWYGRTLVGTTETLITGNPANIQPTAQEISQMLATYNAYFPDAWCTESDIVGTFCGVRVLPAQQGGADGAPFSASRDTVLLTDNNDHPSYIAVYGGKLTTYRLQAQKVMRLIHKTIKAPHQTDTKNIALDQV